MISPKTTMAMVAPMTATRPEVKASSKMVRVLLTKTLPWKGVRISSKFNNSHVANTQLSSL